tara:strand:+ start:8801 stop:9448 length:648 start_codon:yes stop_codon:yes gene_type:complete
LLDNGHHINFFYNNKFFIPKDNKTRPALFLDRDGVIIKEKHFISKASEVELENGMNDLIDLANLLKLPIVIITNQSGIARKITTWDDYFEVTEKMLNLINKDNTVIAIYANGLGQESPNYSWRKPSPSMILNAANYLKLDLSKSFLIGDRLSDLISGLNAGLLNLFHIRTGHGNSERDQVKKFFSDNKHSDLIKIKYIDKLGKELFHDLRVFISQ